MFLSRIKKQIKKNQPMTSKFIETNFSGVASGATSGVAKPNKSCQRRSAFIFAIVAFLFSITVISEEFDREPEKEPEKTLYRQFRSVWTSRNKPKQRPVFQKPHGFAAAQFVVDKELSESLRVGAFSTPGKVYSAWLRFSGDTPTNPSDHAGNTVGLGIKLLNVQNKQGEFQSQDLILQNQPTFFLDTPLEFVQLIDGTLARQNPPTKFNEIIKRIEATEKIVPSLLTSEYWSSVPYRFGKTFAKYYLKPRVKDSGPRDLGMNSSQAKEQDDNFLMTDLQTQLGKKKTVCFDFYVQLFVNETTTPVEKPTVLWQSPPQKIGTLKIPGSQSTSSIDGVTDALAYRPDNGLEEHRPAGALNLARAEIYKRMSRERKELYQLKMADPSTLIPEKAALLKDLDCEAKGEE